MNITLDSDIISKPMNKLCDIVESMPWEDKEYYANYLAQTYWYTFHSTRMLAMAAAMTTQGDEPYYRRCIAHIAEENGHDNMAIADLRRMGHSIEEFPELGVTRALYEGQYYKAMKCPASILGYILALEYVVIKVYKKVYERLAKTYDPKQTNFIRVHTEEDPDHVEKAMLEINKLPENELKEVMKNYEQSCFMFGEFLKNCHVKSELDFTFFNSKTVSSTQQATLQ